MAEATTQGVPLEQAEVRRPGWFAALLQRHEILRGYSLIMPAFLFMAAGILIPFGILVAMSFWTTAGFDFNTEPSLKNYQDAFSKAIYSALIGRSLWISAMATLVTVVLCYPMAYYVAFRVHRNKMVWLILMTLPFWTSYLLRVFAWKIILGYDGMINATLTGIGLIDKPLEFLLYSPSAVIITLAHAWAAFAILPIYVSLEKIDRSLLEAATDLGDGPRERFLRVTLPLSLPGVLAAMMMIFIPTVGDYITPALLGGPDGIMIGNLIQLQFGRANNWPMGATLSLLMMASIALSAAAVWYGSRAAISRLA